MKEVAEIKLGSHLLTLVEGKSSDHAFYQEVLNIRKQAFLKGRFYKHYNKNMVVSGCDPYSKIYCLYFKKDPIGTVIITMGTKGEMHKEHRFPDILLKTPRNTICSMQKLCVDVDKIKLLNMKSITICRQIMQIIEQKAKEENVHTIVISTAISLHKFQMALGYKPIAGSEYKNEVNYMNCLIMVKEL